MKNIDRLFRDSERLQPPPNLWRTIESQVVLGSGQTGSMTASESGWGWRTPAFKHVATVTLAAGLIGLVWLTQHRYKAKPTLGAMADSTIVKEKTTEMLDPELMVWEADLGELELEADYTAEEVL